MIVNQVTVKQLVEFRRYSDQRRQNFANKIQVAAASTSGGGGGDYWIPALSAIANTFRSGNQGLITDKITQLDQSYQATPYATSKIMYQRNLEILQDYTQFDLSPWRPANVQDYLQKPNITLHLHDVPLRVSPHHIFTFDDHGVMKVGGIWFVYWQDGFTDADLGMYTEAMYEYLNFIHGQAFPIDPAYCFTVDVLRQTAVSYQQLLNQQVPFLLSDTLEELNQLI